MINVKEYGAAGDGLTYDTEPLQRALDAGAERGEPVCIPSGMYLTGTLILKSDLHLVLETGAVVIGSRELDKYKEGTHFNRYAGESVMDRCLFFASDEENIKISGGVFDGNGEYFYGGEERDTPHPMMFRFLRCGNIQMEDLRIKNPAAWSTAFIECSGIKVSGVHIISRHFNGDGLDFDSCRDVLVSDCRFDTSDDCLCIQNSVNGRTSKNIVVNRCIMKSRWAAVRIGLLSSGDIEDVIISNCIFHDCMCSGFKIQAAEEGKIHNVMMNNIVMQNVVRPIFITSNFYRMGVFNTGKHRNKEGIDGLYFENMIIECAEEMADPVSGILIVGIAERRIKNIILQNVVYHVKKREADINLVAESLEDKRPEAYSLGSSPASMMFARHTDGVVIRNCNFKISGYDGRRCVAFDDCTEITED